MRLIWLLLFPITLCALPVNNPADTFTLRHKQILDVKSKLVEPLSFRLGLTQENVFNREVQGNSFGLRKQIDTFQIRTSAAFFALDFFDRFTLFSRCGVTTMFMEADSHALGRVGFGGDDHERIFMNTGSNFSWSLGTEILLWQWRALTFAVAGQYFSSQQGVGLLTFADNVQGHTIPQSDPYNTKEWQVDLAASYSFNPMFRPYVALTWSYFVADSDNYRVTFVGRGNDENIFLIAFHNVKQIGYAVGTSILLFDSINLTVEGRFADETALYVNGVIRF